MDLSSTAWAPVRNETPVEAGLSDNPELRPIRFPGSDGRRLRGSGRKYTDLGCQLCQLVDGQMHAIRERRQRDAPVTKLLVDNLLQTRAFSLDLVRLAPPPAKRRQLAAGVLIAPLGEQVQVAASPDHRLYRDAPPLLKLQQERKDRLSRTLHPELVLGQQES